MVAIGDLMLVGECIQMRATSLITRTEHSDAWHGAHYEHAGPALHE